MAAMRAVDLVEEGMVLGLGTGSTARHVLEVIAERRARGELQHIAGVATSRGTEWYARELGIPLVTLEQEPRLDLTLDGADEIDPQLDLIKGLGGALLWEKLVAAVSDRVAIVADQSKLVKRLGERVPLPVEVIPFGWTTHLTYLDMLGAQPTLRTDANGSPYLTDGGHYLLDCRFAGGLADPERIEFELVQRVGIVATGLFLGVADAVVVAGPDGVRVLHGERGRAAGGRQAGGAAETP
ncbi:MAG: ribose-5-phosphate isomerase RpiA [Gemmatimonadetes bacterium]|nr:ribose-5-phosphate isomerase RpiA [Gemmatimonadota bacterium]